MPRITISDELESELNKIRSGEWRLRGDRGLDGVVTFLVDEYKSRRTVESQLTTFRREIASTVKKSSEEGVTEAMNKLFEEMLALVRKRKVVAS